MNLLSLTQPRHVGISDSRSRNQGQLYVAGAASGGNAFTY